MRAPPLVLVGLAVFGTCVAPGRADPSVVVSAFANPAYTKRKYGGEKPLRETYVVMQGRYFQAPMVDRSIERMPFQRILGFFASELARREYWPAKSLAEADLLIAVHWGTTSREVSSAEMLALDSPTAAMTNNADVLIQNTVVAQLAASDQPALAEWFSMHDPVTQQYGQDSLAAIADEMGADWGRATTAQLLGYTRDLRKFKNDVFSSTEETALRFHLTSERYFIILKAYDLHEKIEPGRGRKAVWTLHLNMRSPGTNFRIALDRMSAASVNYFGQPTTEVTTVRPKEREGRVEVGAPVVVGEKKK